MKWIYLKSNNLADALALATVLFHSGLEYHIVRRSCMSPFFSNMDNVHIGFYDKNYDIYLKKEYLNMGIEEEIKNH